MKDIETNTVRDRTAAVVSVAWLVVANKPVFPLYVWWFIGVGTPTAYLTALSAPAFLAIALIGRRHPLAARVALPLVGAVDTVFATKLFGPASGMELFFVPCLLLAILGFDRSEAGWAKATMIALACLFASCHGRLGTPWGPWSLTQAAGFSEVVIFAVGSLSLFIGWRFSRV